MKLPIISQISSVIIFAKYKGKPLDMLISPTSPFTAKQLQNFSEIKLKFFQVTQNPSKSHRNGVQTFFDMFLSFFAF